jgi:hypothetical protein
MKPETLVIVSAGEATPIVINVTQEIERNRSIQLI